ncbi:hypothetical protein SSX86_013170 [Deinandra increscens subsp. villosa]|uniref:Uncharacterized protein n=1 Tax=Deinandra increscens subsp. villosa TaxID=3103831 RepID=A0AAP0DD52_9ASTR
MANNSSTRNTAPATTITITATDENIINGGPSAVPTSSAVGPSEHSMVKRYAKVALKLQGKTLNDVALRCRWMTEKAAYQQVKPSSHATNHAQTSIGSDECINDEIAAYQQVKPSSHATNHALLSTSIDCDEDIDDEISYKDIGGAAAQLLEQNDQAIKQILANLSSSKLHENADLESQTRNNINALLYEVLYDMPEMKQSARQLYDFPVLSRVKKSSDFSLLK